MSGRSGPQPQVGQIVMADVPCRQLPQILVHLVQFYPRERAG